MSAKHTPGPWSLGATQIVVSIGGFAVHAIPISGSGSAIGCVYAGSVGRPRSVEVEYANAALIAAAPDMLAALRDCVFNLTSAERMTDPLTRAAVAAANAAIAKATGEQS